MRASNAQCVIPVNACCVPEIWKIRRVRRKPKKSKVEAKEPRQKRPASQFWRRVVETWHAANLPTSQLGIARTLKPSATQSWPQRWHDGTSLPQRDTLIKIAEKGKTTLDYLIAGWPPKRGLFHDPDLKRLLEAWDCLADDTETRRHIMQMVDGMMALRRQQEALGPSKSDTEGRRPEAG